MNQHELFSKLSDLKLNLQHLLGKKVRRFTKSDSSSENMSLDEEERSDHYLDDLPLTISRDSSPGIKYYVTENSDFARGAEKEVAKGIDSFGERETFDPDDEDDFHRFRDRKHSSEPKRFYSGGINLDEREP